MPRSYDLDRLDLRGRHHDSTADMQRAATQRAAQPEDRASREGGGLYGFRLLNEGDDPSKLVFSFTLFERGDGANLLRVQTDNLDQPLDINEGARLDLGSTAKLRTLVTYLELVAELHEQLSALGSQELAATAGEPQGQARPLGARLPARIPPTAASRRCSRPRWSARYSATRAKPSYTGGGAAPLRELRADGQRPRCSRVREALKHSVNLVFIRLMRDVVLSLTSTAARRTALTGRSPTRAGKEYLARFADQEGREFLTRFYRKYQGKTRDEALTSCCCSSMRAARPCDWPLPSRSLEPRGGRATTLGAVPRAAPAARRN